MRLVVDLFDTLACSVHLLFHIPCLGVDLDTALVFHIVHVFVFVFFQQDLVTWVAFVSSFLDMDRAGWDPKAEHAGQVGSKHWKWLRWNKPGRHSHILGWHEGCAIWSKPGRWR